MFSLSALGYRSYSEEITLKGMPLFTHYLHVYCIKCMFHNVLTPMYRDSKSLSKLKSAHLNSTMVQEANKCTLCCILPVSQSESSLALRSLANCQSW